MPLQLLGGSQEGEVTSPGSPETSPSVVFSTLLQLDSNLLKSTRALGRWLSWLTMVLD